MFCFYFCIELFHFIRKYLTSNTCTQYTTHTVRKHLQWEKPPSLLCCVLSCIKLCDSMDCSPPGSSVHGIFQARILEWLPFPTPKPSLPILPKAPSHVFFYNFHNFIFYIKIFDSSRWIFQMCLINMPSLRCLGVNLPIEMFCNYSDFSKRENTNKL